MYQYLGDTGIRMYDLFNNIGTVLFFIFNFIILKQRLAMPSKLSGLYNDFVAKKNIPSFLKTVGLFTFVETILISYLFIPSGSMTVIMGDIMGTGYNYFGILFFAPLFLKILFLFLSVDPFKTMDLVTPAYPLALISVKFACFFQGCCHGIESPNGWFNQKTEVLEVPVQLIEAMLAAIIFVILLIIRKKVKDGTLYPIYIILYSATRFFSEFYRYEEATIWKLKTYQVLCILGVVVGFVQLFLIKNYKDKVRNIYDKSCYVIIDFINIVLFGFGVRKSNNIHKKKVRWKKDYKPLQTEVKFDFKNVRMWILIWTLGLMGQVGWNIEGTWFNTFVYDKIDKNPSIITPMLILSALATTLSIWLLGTRTDRTGNRRSLMSTGYVVWGILLMGFGLTQFLARDFFSFAIFVIVVADMFISFFGSMSTDVGFSTWLTDIMNDKNRGQIGGAIAVQSVLGSLIGTVVGGQLVGANNNYLKMFFVIGLCLLIFGILASMLFTKKDDVKVIPRGTYKKQLFEVVNYKSIFKHKELLWVNISVAVFFIGFNTYFPHLGNYLIDYLGYSANQMGYIEALPLIMAMVLTVPASKYINNDKFLEVSLFSIVSGLLGAFVMHQVTPENTNTDIAFDIRLFLGILLLGTSYVIMFQATKVWAKKLYPAENKGQYEVLWAVAFAFIPMLFASNIAETIIKHTGSSVLNEVTERFEYIPNGNLFVIGALISMVSIIPIMMTKKYSKKRLAQTVAE